jgi:penicillin-binding protein 1A
LAKTSRLKNPSHRDRFGVREKVKREIPEYQRPKPPRQPKLRTVALLALFWVVFGGGIVAAHLLSAMPDTANLLVYEPGKDITILDIKGRVIAKRGLSQGETISSDEMPDYVGNAFIAIEDRRFRSHFGIDLYGLARAATVNWREGSVVQGGSTLTQQLAKNLFLKPDRTFKRKLDEAVLALSLEQRYTKDQLLTLYLNRVYFGGGVYGIEAAAQHFFGKRAKDLTLTEAAMLAGSVKAPSRYNPATDPDAAMDRASLVLNEMTRNGFITEAARVAAAGERPRLANATATPGAGYFADYIMSLVPAYSGHANERLIVETTLDLDVQNQAEEAVGAGLAAEGGKFGASQGALVAMSPDGAMRALIGGRSYDDSGFDRATEAKRQPGSAFKAFVYLAALEHGHVPDDRVVDGPVTVGTWKPDNYEGAYAGNISLTQAFARSSNSAAVQLTREVGPQAVAETARRLGIASNLHAVPSLALGTSEVTPLELTAGYAAFANGGTAVNPYAIIRIRTGSNRIVYRRQSSGIGRVMSAANNIQMTAMMMETVKSGTGKAAQMTDRPIAGKTGTSQDYRDAWFVGFSSDYVCGVWIGNDSGAPMKKATGGGVPARIFKSFMAQAERDLPPHRLPGQPSLIATIAAQDGATIEPDSARRTGAWIEPALETEPVTQEQPVAQEIPAAPAADEAKPKSKTDLLNDFDKVLKRYGTR